MGLVKITFEFDMLDSLHVWMYWNRIKRRAKKGEDVPASEINTLLSMIKTEEQKQQLKNIFIKPLIEKVLERFNKYNYNFKKERPKRPEGKSINSLDDGDEFFMQEYSLEAMLRYVLRQIMNEDGEDIYKDKDKFIYHSYTLMGEYQKYNSVPDIELTSSKKRTISSFLAIQFGYDLTYKKNPSNKNLSDSARHPVKKFTKKK